MTHWSQCLASSLNPIKQTNKKKAQMIYQLSTSFPNVRIPYIYTWYLVYSLILFLSQENTWLDSKPNTTYMCTYDVNNLVYYILYWWYDHVYVYMIFPLERDIKLFSKTKAKWYSNTLILNSGGCMCVIMYVCVYACMYFFNNQNNKTPKIDKLYINRFTDGVIVDFHVI